MQIIFIDYVDGAGGEFLSYALSQHSGFYKPQTAQKSNLRVEHQDTVTGFLLKSRYYNYNNWQNVAEDFMWQLKTQLKNYSFDHIAIPYHSCYYNHNTLLQKVFPNCKIIYINPLDDHQLIAKEILRKVHLTKINPQQAKHIHEKIATLDNISVKLNDFWALDILLLRAGVQPTQQSRLALIQRLLNNNFESSQVYNHTVPWRDLFYNLDQITNCYNALCNFLNIVPDRQVLQQIQERNKLNLEQLISFDLPLFLEENFVS